MPLDLTQQRRGAIINETAYARGKMLDHSSWQNGEITLPRNITPSDIDMTFDNRGNILYGELSSKDIDWDDIKNHAIGQFRLYRGTIKQTTNLAILCKHSVPLQDERLIDTRTDIDSFHVMLHNLGNDFLFTEIFYGNSRWQGFVFGWFNNPERIRRSCLKSALFQEQHDSSVGTDSHADAGMFAEVV